MDNFAKDHKLTFCNYYVENESGARLDRPELFRILADCQSRDVLLVKNVDRLSRLASTKWEICRCRYVNVMSVSLPSMYLLPGNISHDTDRINARMFGAMNDMLLGMWPL